MAKKPASFEYNGTLVKVLDGDTIDCYIDLGFDLKIKKRIRYMGIDTWESRTRDLDEKARGKMSSKFLLDHIEKAKLVKVKTKLDKKGKFGRVLGSIIADDVDLNEQMITQHLAVAYFGQSKDDIEAAVMANEKTQEQLQGRTPKKVIVVPGKIVNIVG